MASIQKTAATNSTSFMDGSFQNMSTFINWIGQLFNVDIQFTTQDAESLMVNGLSWFIELVGLFFLLYSGLLGRIGNKAFTSGFGKAIWRSPDNGSGDEPVPPNDNRPRGIWSFFKFFKGSNSRVSSAYPSIKHPLTFHLGSDKQGAQIYPCLLKFPHLLIAGTSGEGKTRLEYRILNTLMQNNSPEQLQWVGIDMKLGYCGWVEG